MFFTEEQDATVNNIAKNNKRLIAASKVKGFIFE